MLEWTEELWIDRGPMDELHVEFIDLLNALHAATDDQALPVLDEFIAHCRRHFAEEEAWMEACEFPRTFCHVNQHGALLQVTREVRTRIEAGEPGLAPLLAGAIAVWFRDHATTMDTMLSNFMEDQGYAPHPTNALA